MNKWSVLEKSINDESGQQIIEASEWYMRGDLQKICDEHNNKDGRLVEVVRCGDCRKIMTTDCLMCGFDAEGYCTGGPDNDQYCSFGEHKEVTT